MLIDPEGDHDHWENLVSTHFIMASLNLKVIVCEFFPHSEEMDHTYASQVEVVPPEEAEELRNYEQGEERLLDFNIPTSLENAVINIC